MRDIKDRSPNQSTIDLLKDLLADAEKGELRSVFAVLSFENQGVSHVWSLDARCKKRAILAEMVIAEHDFIVNIGLMEGDSILAASLVD